MEGNVQKIREALRELIVAVCDYHENANSLYYGKDIRSVIAVQLNNAREALTLPLCNCDVGTAEEQQKRFDMFTEKHWHIGKTAIQWAQMPCVEGGAK